MISTFLKEVRLGYSQTGGEANVRIDELQGRLLILGVRANEMAALFAYASREAGLKPLVLDLDGYLSSRVSGYFSTFRLADVLYDLYRMDERSPRWHGELLSSAYTAALDLTFEEEAILDAAMQQLASQDNLASPPAVYDALSGIEGFRGFYVDKLKGRIGTLKYLDAADSVSVAKVLAVAEGAIVDLSNSGMPRAAELGAALFVAKLIATIDAIPRQERPSFILITSVHRVFRVLPKTLHSNRLFTALLTSPIASVLASVQIQALSPLIIQACPVKILSADAWDQTEKERRHWRTPYYPLKTPWDKSFPHAPAPVLPNSFVFEDAFYGIARPFVARPFEAKATTSVQTGAECNPAQSAAGPEPSPPTSGMDPDSVLTKRILREIRAYESPSMPSIISYLSAEFPKGTVQNAIDKLEKDGFVRLSPKQHKSGRTMLALELTPKGIELLGRLT